MLYSNAARRFCTDPGEGIYSSRYYVFQNGLIRAKFAAQQLLVRPGKNICYVKTTDDARSAGNSDSMTVNGNAVTYATAMTANGYQQAGIGKKPVDFNLDDDGLYQKAFHHGHGISNKFAAKIGDEPVDGAKFDEYIAATFVTDDQLSDDVQEQTLSMEGYLKWKSDDSG